MATVSLTTWNLSMRLASVANPASGVGQSGGGDTGGIGGEYFDGLRGGCGGGGLGLVLGGDAGGGLGGGEHFSSPPAWPHGSSVPVEW